MPRRKPKDKTDPNKSKEEALRKKKQLEDLIFSDEMLNDLGTPDIPPIKPPRMMNFDVLKTEVEIEAKSILNSLIKFYMDSDIIQEEDYVNYRSKIDALSISTMAFQMRTAQHAVTKMLEEIDAGGQYQARNFEVLAQMQNQLMQMPAKMQAYIADMEKTYKNLNNESKIADSTKQPLITGEDGQAVVIPGISGEGGTVKVRGNKALMEGLQKNIKAEVIIKKAQIIDEDPIDNSLIDPKRKDLIIPEGEAFLEKEEDLNINLDEDLF